MLFVLVAMFFAYAQTCYSQDQFEGKVTFNVFDDGASHTMQYYIKGSKFRIDTQERDEKGIVIMDPSTKQFMIIMPEQKMYMTMPIPEVETNSDYMSKNKDAEFEKTGETKEILGLTAEKWTFKSGNDQGEAWMAKGLGSFKLFDNPMQKDKPEWQKEIGEEGYFPLEVYDNGKKVYEVTNIEKQSLDNSMFEAPAEYQKMNVPTMQK
jgi:hypothetical protein